MSEFEFYRDEYTYGPERCSCGKQAAPGRELCEACFRSTEPARPVTVDHRVYAARIGEVLILNLDAATLEQVWFAARAAASYALDYLGRESERSAA